MRLLFSLLITALIGILFVSCQDTTIAPGDTALQPIASTPVSPSGEYLLYGVSSLGDALSILDPQTGETALIGPLDPDPKIFVTPVAMAVRSCDGAIFVWNNSNEGEEPNSAVPDGRLLTVDPCTGLGTPVNAGLEPQGQLAALACHPDGRIFGMGSSLSEIDPISGEVTPIGAIGIMIAGADFHPVTGVLYGAELSGSKRFGTINIETGEFTEIGTLDGTLNVIGSLAFDPSGDKLYGTAFYDTGELFEIDPATAAVSNIVPITGDVPQGMGFAPVCGEGGGDCGQQPTELTLVIKPGGCPNPLNPTSKGVLPMAILGGEGTDIDDIDLASIEINGVSPLRSNHEDVGGPAGETAENCECVEGACDGILDLTLKFSTPEIVATLGPVSRGDIIELRLTGALHDGSTFEASECVVIVGK